MVVEGAKEHSLVSEAPEPQKWQGKGRGHRAVKHLFVLLVCHRPGKGPSLALSDDDRCGGGCMKLARDRNG